MAARKSLAPSRNDRIRAQDIRKGNGKCHFLGRRNSHGDSCWVFYSPISLGLAAIYPLQICRIAVRRGTMNADSWTYALFVMLGKFSAFYGILKYWWRRWTRRGTELIEYK